MMKKITILIPVFNDWESLIKLLDEIDNNIKKLKNFSFTCLIVNDASTIHQPKINKPKNLEKLKILNMKYNKGHARCNAFGIRYVCENEDFDYLILMDGDGEDRPIEIKSLINKLIAEPDYSIVAKRIKRSEGLFFQLLYKFHKILTFLFTGEIINFGNYSCLTKKDVKILSTKPSLWSSFSGTLKKNVIKLNEVDSIRGRRYFGPSQMSFFKLLIHSFSIIAVYKYRVLLRSSVIIVILQLINYGFFPSIPQSFIMMFCLTIFLVSSREKKRDLFNSHQNLKKTNIITH